MKKSLAFLPLVALLIYKGDWLYAGWMHSPLDKNGPVFLLLFLGLTLAGIPAVRRVKSKCDYTAAPFIVAALIALLAAFWVDINLAFFLSLILLGLGLSWLLWGWATFLWIVPAGLVLVLSLPTTTFVAGLFANELPGLGTLSGLQTKSLLAGLFSVAFGVSSLYLYKTARPWARRSAFFFAAAVLACTSTLAAVAHTSPRGPAFRPLFNRMRMAEWSGTRIEPAPAEKRFFRDIETDKMIFFNQANEEITALVVNSGGNIHKIHPPEYCLTGSGWQIADRLNRSIAVGKDDVPVKFISANRAGQRILGCYWFSSDAFSTSSYFTFRKACRQYSNRDWSLFFLTTPAGGKRSNGIHRVKKFLVNLDHETE